MEGESFTCKRSPREVFCQYKRMSWVFHTEGKGHGDFGGRVVADFFF